MSDATYDMPADSDVGFVQTALRHDLLSSVQAKRLLDHSNSEGVAPSDAALTLSLLKPYEVDAVDLLSRPKNFAPGFELLGLLGAGANGIVFRARQTALERDIALKTLVTSARTSPTGQARLQREAHAIARLAHPHIVAVYDSGYYQGRYCIAMELVPGESLAELIQRQVRVSEVVCWRIVRQVASGLAHARHSGIIHRDIKPANILLTDPPAGTELSNGVPYAKVVDFGLAFSTGPSDADQITATGATLGTPAYVAPEQLQDTHVDSRADIYSLGATVFHMLAGRPPLSDLSPMRAIMQKNGRQ